MRQEDPDAREVYRDDNVIAFFPTDPATLGHTLVIPRDHTADIWALDDDTAANLAGATLQVAAAVKATFQPDGLNVIQSNGGVATQTVPHLHVHIVPRWPHDIMGPIWPTETNFTNDEKDDARRRLRDNLNRPAETPALDADDHRKHLDFIQAVVTRMSSASSAAKGWLLPVITATYGYAIVQHTRSVALLGVAAVLLFAFLDVNYLRQEKAYRKLYDRVTRNPDKVPLFSLNPADADDPPGEQSCWRKIIRFISRWVPSWQVWVSWSIAPFYGAFVAVGLFISFHGAFAALGRFISHHIT